MLGLFRINDPYRLIIVFVVLLALRLPFIFGEAYLTVSELSWMVIGEKIGTGALLYVDLWTDTGPLAALAYLAIDFVAGRSLFALRFLGTILFFVQAGYLNIILLKHKVFNENSYIPSLIYALYGLLIFHEITLSPQLLGLTFVLFAIDSLFTHMAAGRRTDENPLNIGIYTGIAALFYLPYLHLMLAWLLALLLYSTTIWRRYLLLLYGGGFVFFAVWMYYVWTGNTWELNANFFQSLLRPHAEVAFSFRAMLILLSLPVLILLDSVRRVFRHPGFSNFQVRLQIVFFFLIIVFVFIWVIYSDRDGLNLVLIAPFMSFYLTHSLLLLRKAWKREIAFFIMVLYLMILYFGVPYNLAGISKLIDIDRLLVREVEAPVPLSGKKILVTGDQVYWYREASLATPYFDWHLSEKQLTSLDYYDNVVAILENFQKDMPDVIIDENRVMPDIFERIPFLDSQYEEVRPQWYVYKTGI